MKIISAAKARVCLDKLLEEVNDSSTPLLITSKNGRSGYLIGEDDFNAMFETIYLNSNEGLIESILNESNTLYSEAKDADDLEW